MTITPTGIGITIAACGLLVETVSVIAVTHYAVRRRLPSPLLLRFVGGVLFVCGVGVVVLGRVLA